MAAEEDDTLMLGGDVAYQKAQKLLEELEGSLEPISSAGVRFRSTDIEYSRIDDGLEESRLMDTENIDGESPEAREDMVALDEQSESNINFLPPVSDLASEFFQPKGEELDKGMINDDFKRNDLVFACEMARGEKNPQILLERYSSYCSKYISELEENDIAKTAWETMDSTRTSRSTLLETVKQERNTWDLLYYLHHPRVYPVENEDDLFEEEAITHSKTVQQRINVEFRKDVDFQLWHRVTMWLHNVFLKSDPCVQTLHKNLQIFQKNASYVPYLPKTWDYVSSKRDTLAFVSVIDPDASIRESKSIHPDDEDSLKTLFSYIWTLVKVGAFYHSYSVENGSFTEDEEEVMFDSNYEGPTFQAMNLCRYYGHPWLAASLIGGKPEKCHLSSQVTGLVREGNVYRSLWKYACQKLAKKLESSGKASEHEHAVYSMLAGETDDLLRSPICRSWLDHCWVYFQSKIQARVDEISIHHRRVCLSKTPNVSSPDVEKFEDLIEQKTRRLLQYSTGNVFSLLENSPNEDVKNESLEWYHITQASLIQGNFSEILESYFCINFCGNNWEVLPHRTIASICGRQFIEDIQFQNVSDDKIGLDKTPYQTELSDCDIDEAPCWTDKELGLSQSASDILRFISHLVLYMHHFQIDHAVIHEKHKMNPLAVLAVVTAYLRYIIANKQFECVAWFFDDLPSPLCHALFSGILESLSLASDDFRLRCIRSWSAGIKSVDLNCMMVQCLRNVRRQWKNNEKQCKLIARAAVVDQRQIEDAQNILESLPAGVPPEEWHRLWTLIQCWRWLSFQPSTRQEAVVQANCIFRDLIPSFVESATEGSRGMSTKNGHACWKASCKLLELIETLDTEGDEFFQDQTVISDVLEDNAYREFHSWRCYIQAHKSFIEWNNVLSHLEESFQRSSNKVNKATAMQKGSRAYVIQEKEAHRDRVTSMIEGLTEVTNKTVHDILLVLQFENGWLCDNEMDGDESRLSKQNRESESFMLCRSETEREKEERLKSIGTLVDPGIIKKICIPPLISIFHRVLTTSAKRIEKYSQHSNEPAEHFKVALSFYKQSLKLADVVADSRFELFRTQTREETHQFLSLLRESARELLRLESNVSVV